jgi:hypothetical protein
MLDHSLLIGQIPSVLDSGVVSLDQAPVDPIDSNAAIAGQALGQQLSAGEWLGPLAPIALSPFFGLALLSGAATYGPTWLQDRSALLQANGALNNPWLFWTMAGLALLTSLPRLTKVSKPISLAAEKAEAYSAVIILIAVRLLAEPATTSTALGTTVSDPMLMAGASGLPLSLLMSAMAAINVLVINLIKLLGELVVWLIPIPFIDAGVELANKSACAGLMGLYAYSPTLAMILDLSILAVCLLLFAWVNRRVQYYREMIAGPVLAWLLPRWFANHDNCFQAFADQNPAGLPQYCRLMASVHGDSVKIQRKGWFKTGTWVITPTSELDCDAGILSQWISAKDGNGQLWRLSHRHWVSADRLYQQSFRPAKSLS